MQSDIFAISDRDGPKLNAENTVFMQWPWQKWLLDHQTLFPSNWFLNSEWNCFLSLMMMEERHFCFVSIEKEWLMYRLTWHRGCDPLAEGYVVWSFSSTTCLKECVKYSPLFSVSPPLLLLFFFFNPYFLFFSLPNSYRQDILYPMLDSDSLCI